MKLFKLKTFVNKNNKQVSMNLPKHGMEGTLKKLLKNNPSKLKSINIKIEGYDEW